MAIHNLLDEIEQNMMKNIDMIGMQGLITHDKNDILQMMNMYMQYSFQIEKSM